MGNSIATCKYCDFVNLTTNSDLKSSYYCLKCKKQNKTGETINELNSNLMVNSSSTSCMANSSKNRNVSSNPSLNNSTTSNENQQQQQQQHNSSVANLMDIDGKADLVVDDHHYNLSGLLESHFNSRKASQILINKSCDNIETGSTNCLNKSQSNVAVVSSSNSKTNNNSNSEPSYWIDPDFPPVKKSLFMNGNKVKRMNLIHSNGFKQVRKWLRPNEIVALLEENYLPVSLFLDPSPKDVIQGELGTCWFLSALALLAEKPFLLLNCMVTQTYNTAGVHQVRLCRRGEWIIVNIDDFLPCDKNNQLVFSYGRKKQFWVPFMEKALAKMYGSYEAVARGACAEGLQTLTGEPCEVLYLQLGITNLDVNGVSHPVGVHENSPYLVWQKIILSRKLGYLMTTLCYNENLRQEVFDRVGLLNRHIYSILDAREIDLEGNLLQLIRLRNPWGHKEWKGDWSNGWPKWPEQIKKKLNVCINNDGCFWISFHDMLNYFYDITICKVRADWTESRQSSCFYDYSYGAEVYAITINHSGIHQFEIELFATGRKNQAFDRNADPNVDLCLILCRVNEIKGNIKKLTCIAYEHSVEYYITLSALLTPGNYIVYATSIKALSSQFNDTKYNANEASNHFTYNIIFHGETTFILNRTVLAPEIISDIFYSVALKLNNVKYELNGAVRTYIISGTCTHGIFVENLSTNVCVKTQLDITSSKNLDSTRFSYLTHDYLYPGCKQLIAFLTPQNYRDGFVIGYKLDTHIYYYYTSGNFPPISKCYAGLHAVRNVT